MQIDWLPKPRLPLLPSGMQLWFPAGKKQSWHFCSGELDYYLRNLKGGFQEVKHNGMVDKAGQSQLSGWFQVRLAREHSGMLHKAPQQ